MRILLVGNPNVGKSVVFSQLTGTRVISSNYPGTTVEYIKGYLNLNGERAEVIDVPGSYTLDPTCKAEEVAVAMIPQGNVIINVVDATNLERNLYLTLEVLERQVPVIIALNMWDEARHKGIIIDAAELEAILGVPVVPTAAISGQGIKKLIARLPEARTGQVGWQTPDERFATVGRIARRVQQVTHRHHTLLEQLEDLSVMPLSGFIFGAAVLFGAFKLIRLVGEGLISYIFEPFFHQWYLPYLEGLSVTLDCQGLAHDLLIGQLIDGKIDFLQSLGLLSTGLYVPFAVVFPYIIAFYAVLGFLEDFGYLPRLAVLLDGLMHRVGLHGYAIIPMVLGLGCNVPAALSIRNLESRRQKFIASTLMVTAVPCFSQTAMILALVGRHGGIYVANIFLTLLCIWIILGLVLNRKLRGFTPTLLVEIPPYRLPGVKVLARKLHLRISHFLKEAIPLILAGILVVNLVYLSGVVHLLVRALEPAFKVLFALPGDAAVALLLGFLRKDVALGILAPLNLTPEQLVVVSTVLAVYFPCLATFLILLRELGWRSMLKVTGIMLTTAVTAGMFVNYVLNRYGLLGWVCAAALIAALILAEYRSNKEVHIPEEL
ncbi:MAG: ferrous iron transporter B [Bacillota bacterium]